MQLQQKQGLGNLGLFCIVLKKVYQKSKPLVLYNATQQEVIELSFRRKQSR